MRNIFCFFLILILMYNGFALEVSPSKLRFHGDVGEEICKKFNFTSSSSVSLENRWALTQDRGKFLSYLYNATMFGLDVKYYNESLNNTKRICIKGKNEGSYYGLLLIKEIMGNSGIGIWLNVELNGGSLVEFDNASERPNSGSWRDMLFVLSIGLLCMLFWIVFNYCV